MTSRFRLDERKQPPAKEYLKERYCLLEEQLAEFAKCREMQSVKAKDAYNIDAAGAGINEVKNEPSNYHSLIDVLPPPSEVAA